MKTSSRSGSAVLPAAALVAAAGGVVLATILWVAGGHAAIADATFLDLSHRAMVEAAAKQAGVPFVGIWLSAPLAVLEARVAARSGDASDATVAVLRRASCNDPGPRDWHAVDAADRETALAPIKSLVRSHIAF